MQVRLRLCSTKIVLFSHYMLLVVGFSALGYCAIAAVAARYYQAQASERLAKITTESVASSRFGPGGTPIRTLQAGSGMALLGRVEIPRVQLSAIAAEGDSPRILRLAVGHVPGTALPWQHGNVSLVAHRDTFFRRLGELRPGDLVRITVPGGAYNYQVTFTDVVNPDETWVLQPATGDTLTLVTCYPFHFIGSAPKRFVVRCRRSGAEPGHASVTNRLRQSTGDSFIN